MDILQGLSPSQIEAVKAQPGFIQCVAGAGAGKTAVLIRKIAYEIHVKKMSPDSILALTFTKKAANEMKARLRQYLGSQVADRVYLGTMHAFCYGLIRRRFSEFGLKTPNIRIVASYIDIIKLVDEKANFKAVSEAISTAIAQATDQKNIPSIDAIRAYQFKTSTFTFDDILWLVWRRLKRDPDYLRRLASRYQLVFIDESQDCTRIQNEIAEFFASKHKNLIHVGDQNQSIYMFRNACVQDFIDFGSRAKIYPLATNFRSLDPIVEIGNRIIEGHNGHLNVNAYPRISGVKPATYKPPFFLFSGSQLQEEVTWLALDVVKSIRSGTAPKDIAVLLRSVGGQYGRMVQSAFMTQRIPYTVVGGADVLDSKVFKTLVSFISLATGSDYGDDWMRVLSVMQGFGEVAAKKVYDAIEKFGRKRELIFEELKFRDLQKSRLRSLIEAIAEVKSVKDEIGVVEYALQVFGKWYLPQIKKEEECARACDILSSLGGIMDDSCTVGEALAHYLLMQDDAKENKEKENRVIISTIHRSKGLEWDTVYVPNLNDEGLPWRLAHSKVDFEEECRVFYVAVTRAKRVLKLSACTTVPSDACSYEEDDSGHMVKVRDSDRSSQISRFLTPSVMSMLQIEKQDSEPSYSSSSRPKWYQMSRQQK